MSLEVVISWQIQGCKHPSYVPALTAEKSLVIGPGILLETLGEDFGEVTAAEEEEGEEVCGCVAKALLPHCPPTWPWGCNCRHSQQSHREGMANSEREILASAAPLFLGLFPVWFVGDQRLAQGQAAWLQGCPALQRVCGVRSLGSCPVQEWRGEKSQVLRMKAHVEVEQTLLLTITAGLGLGCGPWRAVWELGWALLAVGAVAALPREVQCTALLKLHLWNETRCSISISQSIPGFDKVWHRILGWP